MLLDLPKFLCFIKKMPRKKKNIKKININAVKKVIRPYFPGLFIIFLALIFYLCRGQCIVAFVNNRPIFRYPLIKILEKQYGQKVLDDLITRSLITQEAKKQDFEVSKEQVEEEIKKIEENFASQGMSLDQLLQLRGLDRKDVEEDIRLQKIVDTLAVKDVEIPDEEIDEYLEANPELYEQEPDLDVLKSQVKDTLLQQKKSDMVQVWLDELRQNAKIKYLLKDYQAE